MCIWNHFYFLTIFDLEWSRAYLRVIRNRIFIKFELKLKAQRVNWLLYLHCISPIRGGLYVCSEGMLTHLFFPVRKFGLGSGQIQMLVVWPTLRTGWLVPHLTKNVSQNWDEMGLGGSVWVHIEGIGRYTVDLGFYIAKIAMEWFVWGDMGLDIGWDRKCQKERQKNMASGMEWQGSKMLVRHVGVF